jgi:hypothetical protein
MLDWLKKYWSVLFVSAAFLILMDAVISSLITCHPIGANAHGDANTEHNQECTAFAGPLLTTLIAVIYFLDHHGEAVTGIFTIVLAAFTGRLWFSTEKLWSVTNKAVELANKEFISTHRPKFRIRRIFRMGAPLANNPVDVLIEVANIGDTDGQIVEMGIDVYIPNRSFNAAPQPFTQQAVIPAGKQANVQAKGGTILTLKDVADYQARSLTLRLLGIINYIDGIGTIRTTSFCRGYDYKTGRFIKVPSNDPDVDLDYEN